MCDFLKVLNYFKAGIKNPLASIYYIFYGGKKLKEFGIAKYLRVNISEVHRYYKEIEQNTNFKNYISNSLSCTYYGEIQGGRELYVMVRIVKPKIVVETGVAAGVSTSFILKALYNNNKGMLYSIDMPNYELEYFPELGLKPVAILPPGEKPGFIVPDEFRKRWILKIGKSNKILPKLLKKIGKVNVFLHDSEHTYKNMMFEYSTVWPYLSKGGLLLSHDINWNSAFQDFSRKVKYKTCKLYYISLGLIIK